MNIKGQANYLILPKVTPFSNLNVHFLKTSGSSGTKINTTGLYHMTKIAAMPVSTKKPIISSSKEPIEQ